MQHQSPSPTTTTTTTPLLPLPPKKKTTEKIKNKRNLINVKAFQKKKKKCTVCLEKFVITKTAYVIIHFVIIIARYLALIRLLFVEQGFC